MLPDDVDFRCSQVGEAGRIEKAGDDGDDVRRIQSGRRLPVAGLVAAFLDSFGCIDLHAHGFRFDQDQAFGPFAADGKIGLLARASLHTYFLRIFAEIDVGSLLNDSGER